MNVVTLLGRLGKEPEIRYTQSSLEVCNVFLATSEKVKGEDKTQWHKLVAFGKTGKLISDYCHKGDQLGIEGKISYGSYEKDGNTVYTTDIIVNRIHFVGKSKQSQPAEQQQYQAGQDDVPF